MTTPAEKATTSGQESATTPHRPDPWSTALWADVLGIPESLDETLARSDGFADVAAVLARPGARRLVVSGSGASYYAAMALWLAATETENLPLEVLPVPAGLLAGGTFHWQDGDVLLAVSASGESRDLREALERRDLPRPCAAVTCTVGGTISSLADGVAACTVRTAEAVTHTQAFCSAVATLLAVWSSLTGDGSLHAELAAIPAVVERSLHLARGWVEEMVADLLVPPATVAFGTGPAWAAALEAALLLKEVSRLPSEGCETREGATTAMTGMLPGHLAVSLPIRNDPLIEEAERVLGSIPCQLLRVPGGGSADRRLAALAMFAPMAALSIELALKGGWNADSPDWYGRYLSTSRRAP